MLVDVGAHKLDLDSCNASPLRNIAPGIAGERNRIHGVGDNRSSNSQIVCSDFAGDSITRIIHRSAIAQERPQCLLNRVNPQVHGGQSSRDLSCHSRFSGRWQTCKDDQHRTSP